MKREDINRLLGITESFRLPEKLMEILKNQEEAESLMDNMVQLGETLDHDWFTEYFEEEHANKTKMAQDFTPRGPADIVAGLTARTKTVADVCAGTGGLMIAKWNIDRDSTFHCYELSERAIPLLLLNMCLRNINGTVTRMNILTGEVFESWSVTSGERFSTISEGKSETGKVEAVISNPPYSQKYDPKKDTRFEEYKDMLPSNFADYVFVAFALSLLEENGKAVFILPHGVLFRGNKEQKFRTTLIEKKYIRTIIGLADKLFLNTDIPTLIMEISTKGDTDGIFFIDAKECYKKAGKTNLLEKEHVDRIQKSIEGRKDEDRFSHLADLEEIEKNDYNLNIPRYVDTSQPVILPDFDDLIDSLVGLENESYKQRIELLNMIDTLHGTNKESDKKLQEGMKRYRMAVITGQHDYEEEVFDREINKPDPVQTDGDS